MTMAPVRVGIIGCGNISETYLSHAHMFAGLRIVAVADRIAAAAKARAKAYGVRAMPVDDLLKCDEIEVVINLTAPVAHFDVTRTILSAGKHAYSEKPLALSAREARQLVADADRRGLKLGSAPDTFLGGGAQVARRLIDEGAIGRVISGSAHVMSHGMEHWHPNPGFFYRPGGGPVFDVGPYYITTLVSLLGPVKAVTAMAMKGLSEREITSAPRRGSVIRVTTPTTINAVLEFRSGGAQVTLGASWDVWKHGHTNPIELYGSEGTILMPDPNFFGGKLAHTAKDGDYAALDSSHEPFSAINWPADNPNRANYRIVGVADLVDAVRRGREPRCSGRLAAHVVEVMESILVSARERRFVRIRSTVDRPPPMTATDARRLLVAKSHAVRA